MYQSLLRVIAGFLILASVAQPMALAQTEAEISAKNDLLIKAAEVMAEAVKESNGRAASFDPAVHIELAQLWLKAAEAYGDTAPEMTKYCRAAQALELALANRPDLVKSVFVSPQDAPINGEGLCIYWAAMAQSSLADKDYDLAWRYGYGAVSELDKLQLPQPSRYDFAVRETAALAARHKDAFEHAYNLDLALFDYYEHASLFERMAIKWDDLVGDAFSLLEREGPAATALFSLLKRDGLSSRALAAEKVAAQLPAGSAAILAFQGLYKYYYYLNDSKKMLDFGYKALAMRQELLDVDDPATKDLQQQLAQLKAESVAKGSGQATPKSAITAAKNQPASVKKTQFSATATLVPIDDSTLIGAKSLDAINAFETALDALQRKDGKSAALSAVNVLNQIGLEGAKTPFGAFTVILAYFGYRQDGKNAEATQMLEQAEQFCNKGAWPYSAFSYLAKRSQESAFLGVCRTDEQEAQARFCIAVNKSLSGVDAQRDFDWLNANLPATNRYAEFARNFNQK